LTNPVRALLFDFGGVIVEIDFNRAFGIWSAHSGVPAATIKSRFTFDSSYASHERGQIGANVYFASLRSSLGMRLSDEQFAEGWNAIFVGEIPGVAALLAHARALAPIYLLSNSNPLHHAYWARQYADILSNFQRIFVSYELGRRKPEAEAFAAIASAIGVPLENILFFDDTDENVGSARRLGMRAIHVKSIADIKDALGNIRISSCRRTPASSKRR